VLTTPWSVKVGATASIAAASCSQSSRGRRLPPPAPRLTGVLWTSSLLAIGFLLLFYHET
jgi:hypothetical protein